jgi:SsrA-binding protein
MSRKQQRTAHRASASKRTNGSELRNLAVNRQAPHYYHLLEKFETGIELTGTEVKAIREGKANLKDAYAMVRKGEVWLTDCHISSYSPGSYFNPSPLRERKLLLHRREIDKLMGRTREKGLTLIPTRLYLRNNLIKCELALAKGKTVWDQRDAIRQRTIDRETNQAIHEHRKGRG